MTPFHAFLIPATQSIADELIAALSRIPKEKQKWSPGGKASTALSQFAECIITNGYTVGMIESRTWVEEKHGVYADEEARIFALTVAERDDEMRLSVARLTVAIQGIAGDELKSSVELPWGAQTLDELSANPYWNMTYHLGQINYIASILGVLD